MTTVLVVLVVWVVAAPALYGLAWLVTWPARRRNIALRASRDELEFRTGNVAGPHPIRRDAA